MDTHAVLKQLPRRNKALAVVAVPTSPTSVARELVHVTEDLRLCTAASSPQQQTRTLSFKAESDTSPSTPLSKRPFGLEAVHEQFGAEQYGIICAILVKQGSSDIAALKANLATLNWKESQRVSHKIKGTVLSLSLTCCADAIALDLVLKRQVAEGDAEGESVALGAVFVEAFDAVLAYITSHPT